jgi:hypothetical protein
MKEFSKGSEVIQLKRFMFYLSQKHTERTLRENKLSVDEPSSPSQFIILHGLAAFDSTLNILITNTSGWIVQI